MSPQTTTSSSLRIRGRRRKASNFGTDLRTVLALTQRLLKAKPNRRGISSKKEAELQSVIVPRLKKLTRRLEKRQKLLVQEVPPAWIVDLPDLIWRDRLLPYITALDVRHVAVTCRDARQLILRLASATLVEPPYFFEKLFVDIVSRDVVKFSIIRQCRHRSGDLKANFETIDCASPSVTELLGNFTEEDFMGSALVISKADLGRPCALKDAFGLPSELPEDMRSAFTEVLRRFTSRFCYPAIKFFFDFDDCLSNEDWRVFVPLIGDFVASLPISVKVRIDFPLLEREFLYDVADAVLALNVELNVWTDCTEFMDDEEKAEFIDDLLEVRENFERRRRELGSESRITVVEEFPVESVRTDESSVLEIRNIDGRLQMFLHYWIRTYDPTRGCFLLRLE